MSDASLLAAWRREEAAPFKGWDFGHIAGRYREESLPWSYEELAHGLMRGARSALDLGTGGGEVLASLHDALPPLTVATEAYLPNAAVADGTLRRLGVRVVAYGTDPAAPPCSAVQDSAPPLPFRADSFEVALARHEAYDAREVARVVAPGGTFLTQQVYGGSYADLLARFGVLPKWPAVTEADLAQELIGAGLRLDWGDSWWGTIAFADVGALVYYLKAIPWLVPDFSVDRFEPILVQLQRELERDGALRFREGRFVIRATKPESAQRLRPAFQVSRPVP